MDEQHRYLYELFDSLEPAVHAGSPGIMKKLLLEIEQNLLYHFSCEEHLMRMYNFPGFAVHQSDHEQVGNRYVEFMDSFFAGTFNAAAAHSFLTGWLSEHSWISDMQYAEWIKKQRKTIHCSSNPNEAHCSIS
jgi:hemerythrin-like metal-binding protein